jgi:SAM-dependent methyltransferase
MQDTLSNSTKIASKYYYNKLAIGFFSSIVLEQYISTKACFEHPTLDLGCADGIFGKMLKETGILNKIDISLDYSFTNLCKFNPSESENIICGDAKLLPLKSSKFSSVFANCVIASVPVMDEREVDNMLSEVCRVLLDTGLFVLTVPTDFFVRNLIVPKLLKNIGGKKLSARYVSWLERNVQHYKVFESDKWLKKLEDAHFQIQSVSYFFSPYQGFWWNIFTLPLFSFWFKFFAYLKLPSINKRTTSILSKIFRFILVKEPENKPGEAGFILIAARKINS